MKTSLGPFYTPVYQRRKLQLGLKDARPPNLPAVLPTHFLVHNSGNFIIAHTSNKRWIAHV